MTKVKLELSLCRPVNVAMMVTYDEGYSDTTSIILGYGFKNMVSYIVKGALKEYRAFEELNGFKNRLETVFCDIKLTNKILDNFKRDYAIMQDCLKESEITTFNSSRLLSLIDAFSKSFRRAWAPTMLCQWYPLWVDAKKLSDIDKKRIDELVKARHERDASFVYATQFFDNIFVLIEKEIPCAKNLEVATPKELKEIIQNKKISQKTKDILALRTKGCVVFRKNVYPISNFETLKKFLLDYNIELPPTEPQIDTDSFKGTPASTGKARGKVRLLYSKYDMDALKEGEIVVSPMTSSYFDPVLPKAAAIVTDEGGVTCHAAIISRELGIPSVIGTKIASRVLSNGDYIEVDGETGVIKKLK
ncbi:hypothetical protein KY358_05975 [Candidatus Woesearchaeota archaeon]|nr:hypothetical protein [Candidatus Woesearchaeota archaeon]